ncbi:MAG: DUF1592 domain-containing protein [Blastocatellia bacterium]
MQRKNLLRLLIVLLPLVWFAVGAPTQFAQKPASKNAVADFDQTIQPFLAENCIACHSAKKASGELNLEQFKTAAAVTEHREQWEMVLLKLRTGEMPPKGAPKPDAAELKAVITWLESEFDRADRMAKPDPGRVTARRLNRAEYNNTVRDLLGVTFKPADDFPQDDSGYGFDNIGDVLSLSPVLMEKYLTAAETVARTAVFGAGQLKPRVERLRPPTGKIKSTTTPITDYDLTGLGLPNSLHTTHRFPVEGDYTFKVFLGGIRPAGSEPLPLALWIDGKLVKTFDFDPDGIASFSVDRQDFGSMTYDFRARVPAGDHWLAVSIQRVYEGLPPSYGGPNPSKRPEPPKPEFKPPRREIPPERLAEIKKQFEARIAEKVPVNEARISGVDVIGPYNQTKGASVESQKKVFVCGHTGQHQAEGHHQPTCAEKIIGNLARRAYRRPVTPDEVRRLTTFVALAQKQGDSFEEGLVQAIQAMLVSPHFLFRIEQSVSTPTVRERADLQPQPIGQHELASRLSYFLWSSMPDDELLQLADQRKLRRPEVLAAQVQRMLKDPKSEALVENFAGQWLELRRLESVKPDRDRFPQFDEYFRLSARRETELFFDHIIRQDRSLLDFIDADYTFLNERLARFYKIPGVSGPEFRKVVLPTDANRGGILTQASVLTVSSYATRTSVVLRGKWILDNVLNAPPPPAPPGVPNLDETKTGTAMTLRQQMEQHRTNPTCAACHARLDPLGFGLENFDAIGGWRTMDGKFPIDSSGVLPDGRSFKGVGELKTILKADRASFAEGVTDKLLTYALGRGLERYDKPVVKQIARNVAAKEYKFSSLVMEIVNSLPFQYRRG